MNHRNEEPSATPGVTSALIVDDERDIRELIALTLERIGIDAHTAGNLEEARHLLATYSFGVCLTDMRLPDGNGVDFVAEVTAAYPDMPIAVITAHGQMDAAVEAMKNGAFDFVSKPVDIEQLRRLVRQATGSDGLHETRGSAGKASRRTPKQAKPAVDSTMRSDSRTVRPDTACTPRSGMPGQPGDRLVDGHLLVGHSDPMRDLRGMIAKVARTNAPVWITGESGTGKELVARLIHRNSPRADGPFVAINCGAIPDDLMESEFFGHRKGSFTGAHSDNPGLFRSAEGGTLFLDEIAELPLHMQVKLLRAIQERSVRAIGDSEERSVDLRILSASHVDLAEAVEKGVFRQDLYYRLNVISVRSPSLRERPEDIAAMTGFVLDRLTRAEEGSGPPFTVSEEAVDALRRHDFPGNVRELENVLERAGALCASRHIALDDLTLPSHRATRFRGDEGQPPMSGTMQRYGSPPTGTSDLPEQERILAVLAETRWNRKRAAEKLGMTYRQLRYRIATMGLDDDTAA